MFTPKALLSIVIILSALQITALRAQCPTGFDPDFYAGAINPEIGIVNGASSYETTSGTHVVLATSREYAGGVIVYDGKRFVTIGATSGGFSVNRVLARSVGSGYEIIAGGFFSSINGVLATGIARFDGRRWYPLGLGLNGSIRAMAFYDDGSGEKLYVGGQFTHAGGVPAANIAVWDGQTWSEVGGGADNSIEEMKVHDDGTGPKLWVGGRFTVVGGMTSNYLANWNGSSWSTFGASISHSIQPGFQGVYALESVSVGIETGLYVGGVFDMAGGVATGPLARWDGAAWHGLGTGAPIPGASSIVDSLRFVAESVGPSLYVGGAFPSIGGISSMNVGRYDLNGSFSALGEGVDAGSLPQIFDIIPSSTAALPGIWVAGRIDLAQGLPVRSLARWDGGAWHSIDGGSGLADLVTASANFDIGSGPRLHVATMTPGGSAQILSFDGDAWTLVAAAIDGRIDAMTTYDDGNGERLYIGGLFQSVEGVAAAHLARFDGTIWQDIGGVVPGGAGAPIRAMQVADVDGNSALFIAGAFVSAGGVAAANIARFDGAGFSALGAGVSGEVRALASHTSGMTTELWLGGAFTAMVNGSPVTNVVRWNGSSYVSANAATVGSAITALASYRDQVYATGSFFAIGGISANNIARFNGTAWSALPLNPVVFPGAVTMTIYDDGGGADLYVTSSSPDGLTANGATSIGSFNGVSWTTPTAGPFGAVGLIFGGIATATVADTGRGSSIYFGGSVQRPGSHVVRFGPLSTELPACGVLGDGADGTVGENSGGPFPVLRVNNSFGNDDHRVNVILNQTITVDMLRPPTVVGAAPFVLFGYLGIPQPSQALTIGNLGTLLFLPCHPLLPTDPASFVLFDSLGLGTCPAIAGSFPAPYTQTFVGGVPFSVQVTLQGLIVDPSAAFGLSVTNAILLAVGP